MADSSPSPSSRKPLLQNVPEGPPAATSPGRVKVIPPRMAAKGEPAPVRNGIGWGTIGMLLLAQAAMVAVAMVWGSQWLPQQVAAAAPGKAASAITSDAPEAGLRHSLDQARAQISALQRQLDAQEQERTRTQGRLQEMADRMALIIQQSSYNPSEAKPRVSESDASQIAAMLPTVTPATGELLLIKERNRLTSYADKAIATGSRDALQALVEAMMDPAMKDMAPAAQAEYKRVQAYYDMAISIDPGYTLPVAELYKDAPATREADLSSAQLHDLMMDAKQPWETRLRAAFLLRSSNDPETNRLLLRVLKEDPMLDVAKQAQITFEKRVGRKFRLFDIPAIESWWQAQGGDKPAVKMIEPSK